MLPHHAQDAGDFVEDVIMDGFRRVKQRAGASYPDVLVILGNDDPRVEEPKFLEGESEGLWRYLHMKAARIRGFDVYGYSCVPPTPFLLKDWEKYDVSAYADPGCIHPSDGIHTVAVDPFRLRHSTIRQDISELLGEAEMERAILLFHTPPHATQLDRAALDHVIIDGVPADCHVGSIAVRRFIEQRQPLCTLHGHIHESPRLTGVWMEMLGRTCMISAAHDGPELALIRFHPSKPASAERELL